MEIDSVNADVMNVEMLQLAMEYRHSGAMYSYPLYSMALICINHLLSEPP